MLATNQINRNKLDNKAKTDIKNLDFMPFLQKVSMDILSLNDGHTESTLLSERAFCVSSAKTASETSTGCEVGRLQTMAHNLRNPKR